MHVEQRHPAPIRSTPDSAAAAPSEVVLVVDDDPDLLDVTRFCLEGEGFHVKTANNGAEALALLRAGANPALVLLDLMMPVMNGWELLGEIARAPSLSTIPVVILTAADRVEMPPGAKALLRKPVDFRSLIEAVELHASGGDAASG